MEQIDNIIGKKLVIIRPDGRIMDIRTYNSQELGLAKVLVEKGMEVSIITAGKVYEERIIITSTEKKIEIYYVPYNRFLIGELSKYIGLDKLLLKIQPDIIQIHEFYSTMSFFSLRWALKNNIKCVLIQGPYRHHPKILLRYFEKIYSRTVGCYVLNNVDAIGCKTNMAAEFVSHYNKRITFPTRVGLDFSRFDGNIKKILWKDKLGLKNEKLLLYVGILEKRRNVDLLIQSLSFLPEDIVLLIVGKGEEENNLRKIAEAYNVLNRCFFVGQLNQEELPALYACCDVFLLPSSYEIYGMVILEAMYFSLPVISSFTAGSQTIIENNENGIIVPTLNVEDWVKEISKLLNDEETYIKIKNRTHKRIISSFTWKITSLGFMELYRKALNNG
ncbi:glycosyl transferase [Bacteroidia bacterium]|nr:glycosyl transferase [Bacteroidia bacterium]